MTSPYLFNTLVEALFELPLPRGCKLITYADDITLVATRSHHRTNSQPSLTLLEKRCRELGFKLNLGKSKVMAFGVPMPNTSLTTAGAEVEWIENHQYLSVWIDRKLTLHTQINYLRAGWPPEPTYSEP